VRRSFCLIALVVSCSRTPAPTETRAAPPSTRTEPPASASAAASAPALDSAVPWLGEGCQATAASTGSDEAWLARVAEACAPGMKPLDAPRPLAPGRGTAEARFTLKAPGGCVRIIAVTRAPAADLSLEVLDASGRSRSRDALPGPVALGAQRGPICFDDAGDIKAVVGGAATALVGAYVAP